MLFNSFVFAAFFAVVYATLLATRRSHRLQNGLLLAASYVFYGWWDVRFLCLIGLSSAVDYVCGLMIDRGQLTVAERARTLGFVLASSAGSLLVDWAAVGEGRFADAWVADARLQWAVVGVALVAGASLLACPAFSRLSDAARRRTFVACSVAANLGLLGAFKYFGFFAEALSDALGGVGGRPGWLTLQVVLPVGISFYTFQTMSYTLDIYRRELSATPRLLDFALFVAFFPQLVAGPIERARHLLPQVLSPRVLSPKALNAGLFLVTWGLFKKVVVADNLAPVADQVFGSSEFTGADLLLGTLAFAFQIYGDFSGYSDMARGLAKLMGFELSLNFRLPYFALSPREFWARWHISLSSWLRDYVYIPLGGNRRGPARTTLNLALTMLLGGLWHGAAWTFVLWGAFHAAILILYRRFDRPTRSGSPVRVLPRMALMFALTLAGWVLFRAESVAQIGHVFTNLGVGTSAHTPEFAAALVFFTAPLILVQIAQQRSGNLLVLAHLRAPARVAAYAFLVVSIVVFGVRDGSEFLYFQF